MGVAPILLQALFLKPGSPCLFCPTPTHSPNPSLPQESDQPLRLPGQIPPCLLLARISDLHVRSWQELPGSWVRDPHPPSYYHFTCQWQFVLQKTQRGCLELASPASQLCTWLEGLCLPRGNQAVRPPLWAKPLSVLPEDQLSPTGPWQMQAQRRQVTLDIQASPADLTRQTVVFSVTEQLFPLLSPKSPIAFCQIIYVSSFSKYLQKTARSPQTLR